MYPANNIRDLAFDTRADSFVLQTSREELVLFLSNMYSTLLTISFSEHIPLPLGSIRTYGIWFEDTYLYACINEFYVALT